jgi:poly-gamma-glutamate synthesis protein (capsule biosynthesis protein)
MKKIGYCVLAVLLWFLPPSVFADDTLIITAVGDNLIHDSLYQPILSNRAFDFSAYYAPVRPLVERAGLAFINQETILGGWDLGFSGYPRFNSPQELGDALIAVGFDVVNQATNHVMDKGEAGVFATLDYWEAHPSVAYLGIHRSLDARNTRQIIIERNNIRLGFLSYTYGTNGLPVPRDKPYLVSLINDDVIAREVDALRPVCDFLIVSMHWGNEYEFSPSAEQQRLARLLAAHNVDLIIGHHPHVLQPVADIPRPDGRTTRCFYSLGNFLSAQERSSTLLGGLMYVKLRKNGERVTIDESGVVPLVTHYDRGFRDFRVYPLYEYTDALAARHQRRSDRNDVSPLYFTGLARRVLGDAFIDHAPF